MLKTRRASRKSPARLTPFHGAWHRDYPVLQRVSLPLAAAIPVHHASDARWHVISVSGHTAELGRSIGGLAARSEATRDAAGEGASPRPAVGGRPCRERLLHAPAASPGRSAIDRLVPEGLRVESVGAAIRQGLGRSLAACSTSAARAWVVAAQLARNRRASWLGVSGSAVNTLNRRPGSPGISKLW